MNLHLISFNIPFPANYGGVIDVFYKIKALKELGIKIHLHCFEYGRTPQKKLEEICEEVYYYKRQIGMKAQLSFLPYIVNSRKSEELKQNLLKDDYPILFEGLHCCYLLSDKAFAKRKTIVRMHNIEWAYYWHLTKLEKNIIKKAFFLLESYRLKWYQKVIKSAEHILAISPSDFQYIKKDIFKNHVLKENSLKLVYPFHHNETIVSKEGKGNYVLFHGDLSVKDNEDAVLFLIEKVFNDLKIELVVAGLNPSTHLKTKIEKCSNIQLKPNVPHQEMNDLLQNAHINILISFQSAGMKLKLLNALFMGRHCLVNLPVVQNTGVEEICTITNEAATLKTAILSLFNQSFSAKEIRNRKKVLGNTFSNRQNALKISNLLANN